MESVRTGRRRGYTIGACCLFAGALGIFGCSDDDTTTKPSNMVTISGVVRDIDKGTPAPGVKVTLYGTSYSDVVATGTDGRYSIQVPKGSKLRLYTDDFDPANDVWFPFLNCDVPELNVDQISEADRSTWPIHCCPREVTPLTGSVAIWDHYLKNIDNQSNGDRFAASSAAQGSGVIAFLLNECSSGSWVTPDSIAVSSSSAAFPVGYVRWDYWKSPDANPPGLMYGPSQAVFDSSGLAFSFGDSTATDSVVTLTFANMKTGGTLSWAPYDCPVRKDMISLVWINGINGVGEKTFKEFGLCVGLPISAGAGPIGRR